MGNKQNRIFYYDMIRFLAIFCVISCHVFAGLVVNTDIFGTRLWYFSLLFNSLRDIAIPLFITLSGALLITKKDSIPVFIKKRFTKVIIPYVFWLILFLIFGIICIHFNYYFLETIDSLIIKTVSIAPTSGAGQYLWFVPMIITVYVIIILINKLSAHNLYFLKIAFFISIFALIVLNTFDIVVEKPYSYVIYSIFAIFGYYLSTIDLINNGISMRLKITNEKLTIFFLIMSIILYLTEIYLNATSSIYFGKFNSISQISILNVSLVASIFLFFRFFSLSKGKIHKVYHLIRNKAGKVIYSISICSYGIYLSHMIVLISLRYFLRPLKFSLPISVFTLLLLMLTLIISWLIILIMDKVPILNKFSGT